VEGNRSVVDQAPSSAAKRRSPTEAWAGALLAAAWVVTAFAAAGTARWPAGWTHVAVVAVGLGAHRRFVARRSPALLERRNAIGEGTRTWDLVWLAIFWPLMLAAPVVAGVDTVRLGHPQLPAWLMVVGGLLFASGMALSASAMVVNPFFEGTARLQPDQRVIEAGPYRRLRHPGYAGLALWSLASPFLLRSSLALVPAVAAAAWLVVRTALEDRMLRAGLAGYGDYARRVRSRLVPGLW